MKETFYFPHDHNARGDEKIIRLLKELGWSGYGLYWALIEKLYEAGGRVENDTKTLAYDLRTEPCVIKKLVSNFGLFYFAGEKIASRSVNRRLFERNGRIEQARAAGKASGRARREHQLNGSSTEHELEIHKEIKKRSEVLTPPPTKECGQVDNSVDKSKALSDEQNRLLDLRMPFGEYKGAHVSSLDIARCQWLLTEWRHRASLKGDLKSALELRVRIKLAEANGMKKVAKL